MPLSRIGVEPRVYVNGNLRPDLRVRFVERSAGAGRLDHAELILDEGISGDILVDRELSDEWRQGLERIEVTLPNIDGEERVIHVGSIQKVQASIGQSLNYGLTSTLAHRHFGERLEGPEIKLLAGSLLDDVWGGDVVTLDEEIVFNPIHHGKTIGNRSLRETDRGRPYFLDVGQTRTAAARRFLGEDVAADPRIISALQGDDRDDSGQYWTLAQAVFYLCWALNFDEYLVKNPATIAELEDVMKSDDPADGGLSPILRDRQLPRNEFLPYYLDMLLRPYGFDWFVQHRGRGESQIAVMRNGTRARRVSIGFQRPGEELDIRLSPAEEIALEYDLDGQQMVNTVQVQCAHRVFEGTFELVPGFDAAVRDAYPWNQLAVRGGPLWNANKDLRIVHRLWVLNEAGDYIGNLVPNHDKAGSPDEPIARPFSFENHLDLADRWFAPRRRRFYPTLTLDNDKKPIGPHEGLLIEYWEPADGEWRNIDLQKTKYEILEEQCGILFVDDFPPMRLVELGRLARIRVTASVVTDRQVKITVNTPSIQPERVQVNIDARTRFAVRTVHGSSKFRAQLDAGTLRASVRDDREQALNFAKRQLKQWNKAECRGTIVLDGIDWYQFLDFEVGDLIDEISGRRIGLKVDVNDDGRRPQIVMLSYDAESQTVSMTLDRVPDRDKADDE